MSFKFSSVEQRFLRRISQIFQIFQKQIPLVWDLRPSGSMLNSKEAGFQSELRTVKFDYAVLDQMGFYEIKL